MYSSFLFTIVQFVFTESLTVEDHIQWQTALGFDTADNVTFELVCRLLFQEKPTALVGSLKYVEVKNIMTSHWIN
jgi:hypothetical protein